MTLMDLASMFASIGIFFGRVANFVNAELYGRVTDVSWSFVFPGSDGLPRHPSQLYEALLEGLVLFCIMQMNHKMLLKRSRASGVFLILYGVFRIFSEFFREPDAQLGCIFGFCTMGQVLSVPMILVGVYFVYKSKTKPHVN